MLRSLPAGRVRLEALGALGRTPRDSEWSRAPSLEISRPFPIARNTNGTRPVEVNQPDQASESTAIVAGLMVQRPPQGADWPKRRNSVDQILHPSGDSHDGWTKRRTRQTPRRRSATARKTEGRSERRRSAERRSAERRSARRRAALALYQFAKYRLVKRTLKPQAAHMTFDPPHLASIASRPSNSPRPVRQLPGAR